MSPSIILQQSTKSIFVAYSERELTFEVNLPTNLGELTFKNTSKWIIDHIGVVGGAAPSELVAGLRGAHVERGAQVFLATVACTGLQAVD